MLKRHRALVTLGITASIVLAFLSYVRVSPDGIAFRSPEVWSDQATLFLTQEGAPELRSILPGQGAAGSGLADTGRFTGLADVYSIFATGDAVARELRRRGFVDRDDGGLSDGFLSFTAEPVESTPLMTITGEGSSSAKATQITAAATNAFLKVLKSRQIEAKIPVKDRVQIRVVDGAGAPKLVGPRSKAFLIVVLFGGLIATVAAAFVRENLGRHEGLTRDASAGSVAELYPAAVADQPAPRMTGSPGTGPTRETLGTASSQAAPTADESLTIERPGWRLGSPRR